MNRLKTFLTLALATFPVSVLAAPNDLGDLIEKATDLVNPLIGLFSGLAVLAFIWGIVKYIFYASDEKQKVSAKNTMVYGVVGLFVLFSVWGIVEFISTEIFG